MDNHFEKFLSKFGTFFLDALQQSPDHSAASATPADQEPSKTYTSIALIMNRKNQGGSQRNAKKDRQKNKSGKGTTFSSKHVRAQENRMAAAAMRPSNNSSSSESSS